MSSKRIGRGQSLSDLRTPRKDVPPRLLPAAAVPGALSRRSRRHRGWSLIAYQRLTPRDGPALPLLAMDELDVEETGPPSAFWAQRHGKAGGPLDLSTGASLFRSTVTALRGEGYFAEWAGYSCVDIEGEYEGTGGTDLEAFAFRKTRLHGLWPPSEDWDSWDLDYLLTAVEFFYSVVSKPTDGWYHDYMRCGQHWIAFRAHSGRSRYRGEVNEILIDVGGGFELEVEGAVVRSIPSGLEELVEEELPATASSDARQTLQHAIELFRARGSSEHDQLDALRSLAAVLESVRPQLKQVLQTKDESDLFEMLNRFAIRMQTLANRATTTTPSFCHGCSTHWSPRSTRRFG